MPKKNNRPKRDVKPVFHIYCEGEKTEPNYLKAYIDRFFSTNCRLKVIKIEDTKKNTPVQLVNEAVKARKELPTGDEFWVIYDRESEHRYKDQLHAKAYEKAQSNSISVAISNVCFEVWLILHFDTNVAPFCNCDDLLKNSKLRKYCKERNFNDYDKGNHSIFSSLTIEEINSARDNAKKLNTLTKKSADSSCTKPYQWNPYTNVYELLDAIDKFAKENRLSN